MKNEEELENPWLTFVNSIVKFIDWIKDAIKNKKSIEYNFGYHCDWDDEADGEEGGFSLEVKDI